MSKTLNQPKRQYRSKTELAPPEPEVSAGKQGRAKGHRPNAVADRKAPKVWKPDFAKKCPWYPQTEAEYEPYRQKLRERLAEQRLTGKMTRAGIRDGWGGKSFIVRVYNGVALQKAQKIVTDLIDRGVVSVDDERAEKALVELVAVMEDVTTGRKDKIAAAKAILDFTKKKPATTANLNVAKPEDFLAALAAQDGK